MKQTVLVKRAPTPEQPPALLQTLEAFNAACTAACNAARNAARNAIAVVALREQRANTSALHKVVSAAIRAQSGVSSQIAIRAMAIRAMAIRARRTVSDADKRNQTLQLHFRPHGARVYAQQICSLPSWDRVSRLTLARCIDMPCRFGTSAEGMLQRTREPAAVLYRTDTVFLASTGDAPEPAPTDADACVGVDLGII